jgi:hypothetical protein
MRRRVRDREPDTYEAILWTGENISDVALWLQNHQRGYDYDNYYRIKDGKLYLGLYELPEQTWLVLNHSVSHYSDKEFWQYYEEAP